jgi:hypothetical protein
VSDFGKTLFSGSRFLFWAIVPLISLFGFLLLPSIITEIENRKWLIAAVDATLVFSFVVLGFSLWNPKRFWLATRLVTAIVFVTVLVIFFSEVVFGEKSLRSLSVWEIINGEPPSNVFKAFIFVGIPCLLYTCRGIWGFKELRNRHRPSRKHIENE